jgi:hypothetical protein
MIASQRRTEREILFEFECARQLARAPHAASLPSAPVHSRRHVRNISYRQPAQNPHDASLPF